MAHTELRANRPSNLLDAARRGMATLVSGLAAWQRAVASRKAIAELTPEQLQDIGQSEALRPTLEIKAGLVTNLMSMR